MHHTVNLTVQHETLRLIGAGVGRHGGCIHGRNHRLNQIFNLIKEYAELFPVRRKVVVLSAGVNA